MADEGLTFERFYSHSSWTRASVATLFSSLLPSGHGIVHSGHGLREDLLTLPEILHDAGYSTLAFVTNPQIHPKLGFAQGIDRFEELYSEEVKAGSLTPQDIVASLDAEAVFDRVRRALREQQAPFFAYVHLIDPHGPYNPPDEFADRFVDARYKGRITGSIDDFAWLTGGRSDPSDRRHFSDLYDGEIAATDASLDRFLDWLDAEGLLETSHVIVTSDHGEEFLEHGGTGHGRKVFEEQVRIPLVWRGPGLPAGESVTEACGLIDLAPTLLDVLGLGADRYDHMKGQSLRSFWTGEEVGAKRRVVFLEEFAGSSTAPDQPDVVRAVAARGWKIVAAATAVDEKECERLVWYDLVEDPTERSGVEIDCRTIPESEAEKRIVKLYSDTARAFLSDTTTAAPEAELSEEHQEMLRSLGYLD